MYNVITVHMFSLETRLDTTDGSGSFIIELVYYLQLVSQDSTRLMADAKLLLETRVQRTQIHKIYLRLSFFFCTFCFPGDLFLKN